MSKIKELYNKYKEIVNYLIFGVLTTIVSLVVKYGLLFTILDAKKALELQIAVIVSWIIACTFAYIVNRKYVFNSNNKNIIFEVIKFFSSRLLTLGLEMLLMFIFITLLKFNSKIEVIIWTIIVQGIVIIGNYVLSKLIVFKEEK